MSRLKNDQVLILNVCGLGGVGKTSLVRELIEENGIFDAIVWQTAKKQFMDQGRLLHQSPSESVTFETLCNKIATHFGELVEYKAVKKPHERMQFIERLLSRHTTLVVMDNFETIDQNPDALIKSLTDVVAGTPSKVILTCRSQLEGTASYKLEGLSLEETAELLNHELSLAGTGKLSAEKILSVHKATNGLPLAIKLIAAQARTIHVAALDEILRRLSAIDFKNPAEVYDRFYRFIYREIWKGLSKDAKKLLIVLSTFSIDERITYENLQTTFIGDNQNPSNKSQDRFEQAFSENIKFALLESKEINNQHTFFIHPLTKTFVRAELLKEAK